MQARAHRLRRKGRSRNRTRRIRQRSDSAEEIERYFHFRHGCRDAPAAFRSRSKRSGPAHRHRVRFEGVRFVEAGKPWCDHPPKPDEP